MPLLESKSTIALDFIPFILPVICMVTAIITGLMLFSRLKPGFVCELEDSCFRCHLLYGIAIGSIVLGFVSTIKELIYFAQNTISNTHIHSYECMSSMAIKIGLFSFLSWLCIKGRDCLISNCSYKEILDPMSKRDGQGRKSLLGVCTPACAIIAQEAVLYQKSDARVKKDTDVKNKEIKPVGRKLFSVKKGRTESHSKFISKATGL